MKKPATQKTRSETEGQGVGGKHLKNPEEITPGNHLYKTSRDERKCDISEGKKNLRWTIWKYMEGGKVRKKIKEKQMPDDAESVCLRIKTMGF